MNNTIFVFRSPCGPPSRLHAEALKFQIGHSNCSARLKRHFSKSLERFIHEQREGWARSSRRRAKVGIKGTLAENIIRHVITNPPRVTVRIERVYVGRLIEAMRKRRRRRKSRMRKTRRWERGGRHVRLHESCIDAAETLGRHGDLLRCRRVPPSARGNAGKGHSGTIREAHRVTMPVAVSRGSRRNSSVMGRGILFPVEATDRAY